MIALDYQPMSIVEDEGFKSYTEELNSEYKLPSRKILSESLIPAFYNEVKDKLVGMLAKIKHLSVTTDMWSSSSNKSYITLTGHFICDFMSYSVVLATEEIKVSHSGENIVEAMLVIPNKFDIANKVVTVVTDNARNMKKAITDDLKKYNHFCIAHTLNLSVENAIEQNKEFSDILTKCRALVTYFKRSNLAAYKLREVQKQMNQPELALLQDVSTRWNSEVIMLERLQQLKVPVTVALTSLKNAASNLDADEWLTIEEIIPVFKPVLRMTEQLSGDQYPTISLVIPLIRGLQKSLQNKIFTTDIASRLKESLLERISRRLSHLETNKFVSKAVFLDPRFKKSGFGNFDNANTAQQLVIEELSKILSEKTVEDESVHDLSAPSSSTSRSLTAANDEDDIWLDFDEKIAVQFSIVTPKTSATLIVKQYVEMPYLNRKDNLFDFWKQHHYTFPDLYELACKYLSIPATSVPSERIFSKAGLITKDRRNRIGSEKIDQIIFLNQNIKYIK